VTFDAGGLQIKPDKGMMDMKMDMAGAAATIATFWYLDQCNVPKSIVGAVGLVENLLGGSAFKPLDIVRAHNGLSVEIHHTDAEGRLVLGDLASYISKNYMPRKSLISIATLTGACMHALGYNYAGLISKDEKLAQDIQSAANRTNESIWRLPLDEYMIEGTHAKIADRKNLSPDMMAGASMGAAFISEFVFEPTKYAHLDIAGPAYRTKPQGIFPSEGTGFGTEILLEYVLS
jgi:leucyl aminopeptidase